MMRIFIVITLLGLTGGALFMAYSGLPTASLDVHGWTAFILGIGLSFAVGGGLLGLVFYSSRHGYDEPAKIRDDNE